MAFLEIIDLHKSYGDGETGCDALRGVSFDVQQGEFLAVRGPSGCGKSTLLHIVGAMDLPTSGEVRLNGRRLDELSNADLACVRRRDIGFVFQTFNLLPTLSALENVALPLTLDGINQSAAQERATKALEAVDILSRAKHFPSQLSGGEMQRVAIARAVAIEPDLIVADEPTGSLDSDNGRRVLELLAHLNQSRRITILMATHAEDAAAVASRTLNIRDGRLVEAHQPHATAASV